jgi:hypothetical protein
MTVCVSNGSSESEVPKIKDLAFTEEQIERIAAIPFTGIVGRDGHNKSLQ